MTTPYYSDDRVTVHAGDCLDVLATLPDASVDSVVTDPPYGLEFMGREWDGADGFRRSLNPADVSRESVFGRASRTSPEYRAGHLFQQWCERWATECLRVLKPGGHMLAFGGTRTWHRLSCAIEDAGFDIRDSISYLYGSGFPKSLDVSKAIDKAAGAEREVIGQGTAYGSGSMSNRSRVEHGYRPTELRPDGGAATLTAPATPEAQQWSGWGTALKPGFEPIVVARKPFKSTVAANVLEHGTGALNIDGCRIEGGFTSGWSKSGSKASDNDSMSGPNYARDPKPDNPSGRWPANVVLDETQAGVLDQQSGQSVSRKGGPRESSNAMWGRTGHTINGDQEYDDQGGASRFFYTAKADSNERPRIDGIAHPTVKPLDLMRWLVRLVTPPGGTILDPFAGSGTTGEAALLEGFQSILIERETDYLPLIVQRIHRRLNPVEAIRQTGGDLGLFGEPT